MGKTKIVKYIIQAIVYTSVITLHFAYRVNISDIKGIYKRFIEADKVYEYELIIIMSHLVLFFITGLQFIMIINRRLGSNNENKETLPNTSMGLVEFNSGKPIKENAILFTSSKINKKESDEDGGGVVQDYHIEGFEDDDSVEYLAMQEKPDYQMMSKEMFVEKEENQRSSNEEKQVGQLQIDFQFGTMIGDEQNRQAINNLYYNYIYNIENSSSTGDILYMDDTTLEATDKFYKKINEIEEITKDEVISDRLKKRITDFESIAMNQNELIKQYEKEKEIEIQERLSKGLWNY